MQQGCHVFNTVFGKVFGKWKSAIAAASPAAPSVCLCDTTTHDCAFMPPCPTQPHVWHSAAGVMCIADAVEPPAKGAAADKAATSTKSHKSSDSAAKPDSAAMPVPADGTMTAAEPAAASEEAMSTDKPVASPTTAVPDKQENTEAGEDEEVPATDTKNGPAGVTKEQAAPEGAGTGTDKAAALSAAFAEAEVAGEKAEEAAFAEARKSGQSAMAASAEAETAKEEAAEEALEEVKQVKRLKEEGRPAAVKDAAVVEHEHHQVCILRPGDFAQQVPTPLPFLPLLLFPEHRRI